MSGEAALRDIKSAKVVPSAGLLCFFILYSPPPFPPFDHTSFISSQSMLAFKAWVLISKLLLVTGLTGSSDLQATAV